MKDTISQTDRDYVRRSHIRQTRIAGLCNVCKTGFPCLTVLLLDALEAAESLSTGAAPTDKMRLVVGSLNETVLNMEPLSVNQCREVLRAFGFTVEDRSLEFQERAASGVAAPAPTPEDTARLDVLEQEARESNGLHLHDGSHRGCRGLGLRDRTLRQAIDQFADFDHARHAADSSHKGETP